MLNEIHSFHSNYKGYNIIKVTQSNNRVTYDIKTLDNSPVEWAHESLKVARATIDSIIEIENRK